MPCFLMFYASFSSRLIRVTCSHVYLMLLATLCLDLCVYVLFAMFHAQIYIHTCLYAWIHVLPCLCISFLHVCLHISMPICLDLCFHLLVCLDLCSLHALCHLPCACALHAMFLCLDLGHVRHAMCYCSLFVTLSSFLVFWPIGSDSVQTLCSLSMSIHLSPYQRVWITFFACLCLLDTLSGFVVVQLHPMPTRPCLGVTIQDASP